MAGEFEQTATENIKASSALTSNVQDIITRGATLAVGAATMGAGNAMLAQGVAENNIGLAQKGANIRKIGGLTLGSMGGVTGMWMGAMADSQIFNNGNLERLAQMKESAANVKTLQMKQSQSDIVKEREESIAKTKAQAKIDLEKTRAKEERKNLKAKEKAKLKTQEAKLKIEEEKTSRLVMRKGKVTTDDKEANNGET